MKDQDIPSVQCCHYHNIITMITSLAYLELSTISSSYTDQTGHRRPIFFFNLITSELWSPWDIQYNFQNITHFCESFYIFVIFHYTCLMWEIKCDIFNITPHICNHVKYSFKSKFLSMFFIFIQEFYLLSADMF